MKKIFGEIRRLRKRMGKGKYQEARQREEIDPWGQEGEKGSASQ